MDNPFGKKKLIKDISANSLQTIITQSFGLIIFYLTSRYLSKADFGEFNWSMAVGTIILTIASLGLDVVFVKRVALNDKIGLVCGIHFFHTLAVSTLLSACIFVMGLLWPAFDGRHPLFLMVFISLSVLNISSSFRLCMIGLEAFKQLAFVALCTNLLKFSLIMLFYFNGFFTIDNVILAFIATNLLEFVLGYLFVGSKLNQPVRPLWRATEYKAFIVQSLPQLGVVFFDSALARIDWILLGVLSTAAITAEYSFAYRMYESSKLPLVIISPILLTRFSKLFNNEKGIDNKSKEDIQLFFKTELFVIMLIPIVLVCCWSTLIDFFTSHKYGEVNDLNYMLLAGCVPLHCISNFLWSMGFAQGQLRSIMFITIAVAVLNFCLNLVLIPLYGSNGASIAFLVSTIIQTLLYAKYMDQRKIALDAKVCLMAFVNAIVAVAAGRILTNNAIFATAIALAVFTGLGFATNQINVKRIKGLLVRS